MNSTKNQCVHEQTELICFPFQSMNVLKCNHSYRDVMMMLSKYGGNKKYILLSVCENSLDYAGHFV